MITHLIDTNAVIALIGRKSDMLLSRVMESDEGSIGLSTVVMHELYYGAYKSAKISYNLETLRLFMADFPAVGFEREDALAAGEIRAALAAKGKPIGPYDVLIAAQARSRDLVLVTNNVGEFQRVEGLCVEDWTVGR
ncbi:MULTISPECIES: type II toxin-antitoxin system VapC family toxin [Rhizobium]|uniref:type II toxin-antitoxin system VapC family toxin n=1 Tax=Rhizobium TaxID=379 RepID=UPI001B3347AA|nr:MULTISPECIES: type II toxin-antitoxin system VapC family toxin [Rhizobium]MBX4908936.1 type II toxin-antitoxin system VapC family toxin [Rhizobium bangladeshense]MBX5216069.1 type II toxin-antitoxin system VapC family toxin [Rhizobium sp. NLR9a]MBX5234448.1 type II toxin-antitoxin system VapC family toxin [Rhizobium sp. NLR4a]MBX5246768.1 type II toxin-antitoxin system VapC family toxin [Rhizobium sp. NLR3b]MBX5251450.1 type II toxin-antitoxin system VapC family toxin [Rhizobium sp. NLR4b]